MYARQLTSSETYTLSEARRIIRKEQKLRREIIVKRIKFFLISLICLLACYFVPSACSGDCTAWFLFVPLTICFFVKAVKGDIEV